MAGLLREPLLHFILIGAVLFYLYSLTNDITADNDNRIVISEADVDRLISLWEMKWKRLPTEIELDGLIESHIREEVLYREALAMGLDKDDTIVRRRMAQKVEFISSGLADQIEPSEQQLQAYLDANADKFLLPARISFTHIYLNADRRGDSVRVDAERMLADLNNNDDPASTGDPFMFGNNHDSLSKQDVARLFGNDFAEQIFSSQTGQWLGPLESGYGQHLVHINDLSEASRPALDEIREKVKQEWSAEQRRQLDEAFYKQLRSRYRISVETAGNREPDQQTLQNQACADC